MSRRRLLIDIGAFCVVFVPAFGQTKPVPASETGDGGLAIEAQINGPSAIAVDQNGNLYVYESYGGAIRRIDSQTGRISTVARECNPPQHRPRLAHCFGPIGTLRVSSSGKLLFSEFTYDRVSAFDLSTRTFSVIAGNRPFESKGDGGPARAASISGPHCLTVNHTGNMFVCDSGYYIRRIDAATGVISTVAGSGKRGFAGDGRPALAAQIALPLSVAVDEDGNFYIADDTSNRIRRVDAKTGVIETVLGVGKTASNWEMVEFKIEGGPAKEARVTSPRSLAFDHKGNLLFTTAGRVCRIDRQTGVLSTIAGIGVDGFDGDGGPAKKAQIGPVDIAVDQQGNIFIAEFENNRVRRVDAQTGVIATVGGNGFPHRRGLSRME